MLKPSLEQTLLAIRRALSVDYDPDQDSKDYAHLYRIIFWPAIALSARMAVFYKPMGPAWVVNLWHGIPLFFAAAFYFIRAYLASCSSQQIKTVAQVDQAIFEVYDHAQQTGDFSRLTVRRILSRHSLPPQATKNLTQRAARIEHILQDALRPVI